MHGNVFKGSLGPEGFFENHLYNTNQYGQRKLVAISHTVISLLATYEWPSEKHMLDSHRAKFYIWQRSIELKPMMKEYIMQPLLISVLFHVWCKFFYMENMPFLQGT